MVSVEKSFFQDRRVGVDAPTGPDPLFFRETGLSDHDNCKKKDGDE